MLKCVDLPTVIEFFIMFHNDKPVDWLLDHMIQTKACSLDRDTRHCKKAKESVWLHYKPSLFQHVGMHSSLRGKVQKLKDKQFGKVPLHFGHKNPTAQVATNLKAYKTHTAEKAYLGETFFWGLLPQAGDWLTIRLDPPISLESFLFRSGNAEHPNDKFYNTTVEMFADNNDTLPVDLPYPHTTDGFLVVARFNEAGIAQGTPDAVIGPIRILRLKVHMESDTWVILSEIHLVPKSHNR